jgi:CC2D2A N-terminal C2 domain
MELEFVVVKENYVDDKDAIGSEVRRRNAIRSEKIFVELLVNGELVGRSGVCGIEWPSFEVKIME